MANIYLENKLLFQNVTKVFVKDNAPDDFCIMAYDKEKFLGMHRVKKDEIQALFTKIEGNVKKCKGMIINVQGKVQTGIAGWIDVEGQIKDIPAGISVQATHEPVLWGNDYREWIGHPTVKQTILTIDNDIEYFECSITNVSIDILVQGKCYEAYAYHTLRVKGVLETFVNSTRVTCTFGLKPDSLQKRRKQRAEQEAEASRIVDILFGNSFNASGSKESM